MSLILEKIHMHPTLKEARNGLVRQMLLIGPKKVLQSSESYTRYLKFLTFLLYSVVYYDFSESLSGGLKNKVLWSH